LTEPEVLLDSARLVGGVEAGTRSEKVSSSKVWATWIVEGADESTEGARLIVAASSRAMELVLLMLQLELGRRSCRCVSNQREDATIQRVAVGGAKVAEWLHAWQIWCKKDIVGDRENQATINLTTRK
jgi:hypothetical protein